MDSRSPFSFAARLLILISLVSGIGGTASFFWSVKDSLPPGSFPVFLFAMPPFLVVGLFFGIGLAVMRALGLPFYNEEKEQDEQEQVERGMAINAFSEPPSRLS